MASVIDMVGWAPRDVPAWARRSVGVFDGVELFIAKGDVYRDLGTMGGTGQHRMQRVVLTPEVRAHVRSRGLYLD